MSYEKNICDLIIKICEENPDAVAISHRDEYITYHRLYHTARMNCVNLVNKTRNNETVLLLNTRSIPTYVGVLAILFSGCSYSPIDFAWPQHKIEQIIQVLKPKIIVGEANELKLFFKSHPELVNEIIPFEVQLTETNSQSLLLSFQDRYISANDTAYTLFTSGSTGVPKGVQISHKNLISFVENFNISYPLPRGLRFSQCFDLSFDVSIADMFVTWSNVGTLCVLDKAELTDPSEYIVREKIDFWFSTPTTPRLMYRLGSLTDHCFPNLKYSFFIGEPLTTNIVDIWHAAAPASKIVNAYGPTEATVLVSLFPQKSLGKKVDYVYDRVPIGKSLHAMEIKVIDEEDQECQPYIVGEVILHGDQIAKGYMNDIIKTAENFRAVPSLKDVNKWYFTGDLGFTDADGLLHFSGRKDDQIKIAGQRVELGDIEVNLQKSFDRLGIFVVPKKSQEGNIDHLVGVSSEPIDPEAISSAQKVFIRKRDKSFFPRKFIVIDALPVLDSGKIDRKKLETLISQKEKK